MMCTVIPFARKRPSSAEVALEISGMSNGEGAALGLFKPLVIDLNLCGSNEDFARINLPQIRVAILTCKRDGAGVREVVRGLEIQPGLVAEMMQRWDETAAYFGELISIMALAHERFEIVANELGIQTGD
jgi:hypothetical protein